MPAFFVGEVQWWLGAPIHFQGQAGQVNVEYRCPNRYRHDDQPPVTQQQSQGDTHFSDYSF